MPRVKITARRPVVLTEGFHNFPHSLQANSGIVPQIRPLPLSNSLFTDHPTIERYAVRKSRDLVDTFSTEAERSS
jgi:hypothetical protein